jgi:TonB-linked SusC/RagA family outer membrane protein
MRKLLLLIVTFAVLGFSAFAQKTVTGKVSDDAGEPLPGVSVNVQGTTIGTMTLGDGTYTINVPEGSNALVFSYVGMLAQTVQITGNVMDVSLVAAESEIGEIIVTALGISRDKKSLGYAIQEVGGEDLTKSGNTNLINSISGKVAGLSIRSNTNMGGSSDILLRGSSSLVGNNQVLFIVDGVPINNMNTNNTGQTTGRSGYDYGSPVADINPNDIANISVLKGAAATALYGSRAANGVILITTKKGEKSKTGKTLTVGVNHTSTFSVMDKSTFPKYQTNYGAGYGPYYSGIDNDGIASDYEHLLHYDFNGDGTLDYVIPTTEDASMGNHYDQNLMVYQYDAFYPELDNYNTPTPFVVGANLPDYFFGTGKNFTTGIDISGGTQASTFRFAYTNTDQTGLMPNSFSKKNNFLFTGSFDISEKIKITASANYINNKTNGRNNTGYNENILSMFRQWFNLGVDLADQERYYNETGKNITWNPTGQTDLAPIYWDNPYWQVYENYQNDERNRLVAYTQADWKITNSLSFMGRASVDYYYFLQEERKANGSIAGEFGVGRPDVSSGYARNTINFTETNFDAMLKFQKDISDIFNINAFVGINSRRTIIDQVYASTNGGLAVPKVYALSNSATTMLPPEESYTTVGVDGVFANISLGYNNMLFLDLTGRNDWSSTLPVDNNSYPYPSATLSFIFSQLLNVKQVDLGKVRFNYAKVGNDAPWGSVYDGYRIVSPYDAATLVRFPNSKNNLLLKPELSTSLEAGLEMSMFNKRVGFDFAVYKANTINQVVPLTVSRVTGYISKMVNIGEVENKGIELSLNLNPVRTKDLRWNINLNWAKNVNNVVSLGGDIQNLQLGALQGGLTINAREGEPYGVIQGSDYVLAPDGQRIVKSNGYYQISSTSDKIIGNINPDWNAGLTNTLTYKGISLNFLLDCQMGGSIFSLDQYYGLATGLYAETDYINDNGVPVRDPVLDANGDVIGNYYTSGYDATLGYASNSGGLIVEGVNGVDVDGDGEWTSADTYTANIKRVPGSDYRVFGYSRNPNSAFVYDATYLKLREASLSYSLPKKLVEKAYLSAASISLVGSNLWIIYKALPHADPEASQGSGNIQGWQSGVFPTARNFGFSINLTF